MEESVKRYTCDGCNDVTEDTSEITTIRLETSGDHPKLPGAPGDISDLITGYSSNSEPELHFCKDCWDIDLGPGGGDPEAYLCTESGTKVAMMQKSGYDDGDYLSREGAPTDWKPPFELVEDALSE